MVTSPTSNQKEDPPRMDQSCLSSEQRSELMHIKREPTGESREPTERPMDINALHPGSYQNSMDTSRHQGTAVPMRTIDYSGYERNFDQRLVNPVGHYPIHQAYTTPPSSEMNRQEKLQKELNNYMLQNNIPTTMLTQPMNSSGVSSPEPERAEMSPAEMNMLKMKRSNGKLAIPEMLHSTAIKTLDIQSLNTHQRAKREFVPDEKKDEGYWTKRVKNNDSARRSRVKRKALEKIMEGRLMELQQENIELRHELNALKRRYGIAEEPGTAASPADSYNYLKSASGSRSSTPPEKLSLANKDDELEHQSSASDDSRSLDDSRSYVRSASALSQSLDPSHRDRADSFSSCGSSANRSPNSNSSPFSHNFVRTDKTGALDLTSDFGTRATTTTTTTSSRDYSSSTMISPAIETFSNPNTSDNASGTFSEEKMESNMRGFPLKCRWKLSAPCVKNASESNGSFPSA